MSSDPLADRLARIETALATGLGIDLSKFDPQDVVAARAARFAEAGEKAAAIVKKAFETADLTVEQRLARIEAAINSGSKIEG